MSATPPDAPAGRVYGYARRSTSGQDNSLPAQLQALQALPLPTRPAPEHVRTETLSGTVRAQDRPVLSQLLTELRPGDVLSVPALDRLGRSVLDVLATLADLDARGIRLVSARESLDFGTPVGRALAAIIAAFAQMEREFMLTRQREARAAAQAQGRLSGRPRVLPPEHPTYQSALRLLSSGESVTSTARLLAVPRSTLQDSLRRNRTAAPATPEEVQAP